MKQKEFEKILIQWLKQTTKIIRDAMLDVKKKHPKMFEGGYDR